MIISFNEDIDSFPGLAHEFRVRPLTSNQSWDQDLSVLDDMATFTASDASENLFLNDAYIWSVTVDFVNFVDSGSFECSSVWASSAWGSDGGRPPSPSEVSQSWRPHPALVTSRASSA
jgi:hypothetical protein